MNLIKIQINYLYLCLSVTSEAMYSCGRCAYVIDIVLNITVCFFDTFPTLISTAVQLKEHLVLHELQNKEVYFLFASSTLHNAIITKTLVFIMTKSVSNDLAVSN